MEKIIKNKVKDTKTLTLQAFLDDFTFNTLKDANKRDVTKLKNAMRKRGWTSPVFTWQKFVVDGTGRRKAVVELLEEGYTFPEGIPYVEVEAKDMAEAKQLALDFSSQHGYITKNSFLEYTADFEVDFETMQIAGFDKDKFIDTNENDDDVPDVATEGTPLTSAGDIYELGAHRVMCGDATKLEDVEKLMNGRKADSWITDPHYNVAYEGWTGLTIQNDSMEDGKFLTFLTDAFVNAVSFLKAGGVFYIWHADSECYNFRAACKAAALTIRQTLIWNKSSLVMGHQDYQWKHEPCLYGWKDGASHLWNSDRAQTTVLEFDKPKENKVHPTMKPVELISYQITNNTKGEDIVLDTFLGSGTTLIAAHKLGRVCYGMELDPKYADVIISRYVEFTGNNKIKKNGIDIIWEIKK